MEKLFLLRPGFTDPERNDQQTYFCPPCALIEGALSFYPVLREKLEITYVDFIRPRKVLVDLLGEAHQSCPVLVKEDGGFIDDENDILNYLAENYSVGRPH